MLDIAPQIEHAIITQAQNKGMSVNELPADIFAPKQAPTLYDMAMAYEGADVSDIELEPTPKDMLLIDFLKTLPKPTSYFKNAVELQREWRSEWDRTGDEKILIEIPPQLESEPFTL